MMEVSREVGCTTPLAFPFVWFLDVLVSAVGLNGATDVDLTCVGSSPSAACRDSQGFRRRRIYTKDEMTLNALWQVLIINAERNFSDFVPETFANGTDTGVEDVSP